MKILILILTTFLLQVSASTFAQRITLNEKNATLISVFEKISKQSGIDFLVTDKLLIGAEPVTINVKNEELNDVLRIIFDGQLLTYTIKDQAVVVSKKVPSLMEETKDAILNLFQNTDLRGQVVNAEGTPLVGASITVKGGNLRATTRGNGVFFLPNVNEKTTLVITYVGYATQELKIKKDQNSVIITMQLAENKMEDVIITGTGITRRKETFTGATSTFTGAELRAIGTKNILESLKTLDPSFVMVPNNLQGSNPNALPTIEMRGKTSFTSGTVRDQFGNDPNQPLFILNGMETTLQQIVDLDINRVASITLLKDASSTAIYGSRAANGVLVVETIQPRPGDLSVSYTSDLRLELPDLRDYNMMSAGELLEFQRLAGLYSSVNSVEMDNMYNDRLKEVKRGVNTYWLNVPLRSGFTNGHSLRVGGGSQEFQYSVNGNYRKLSGVMQGSGRDTWGGTVELNYRKNKLNISNQTYINGTNTTESPYGVFSQYVNMSPIYRKYRDDGSLNTDRYLATYYGRPNNTFGTVYVPNPLFNASLNNVDKTTSLNVQNNLALIYNLARSWRLSGGLQIQKGTTEGIKFIPAGNTAYDNVDIYRKGQYTNSHIDPFSYQGNAMLTYSHVFKGVHSLTGNVRGELQHQQTRLTSYIAEGFPNGVLPNPAFSYGYQDGGKPSYSSNTTRRVNGLASINYAYDSRYYVDLNYRIDGTTAFGSQNRYSPFWSAGLGWTLSKERFFQADWLSLLRVRGNIGTTGNQALGSYTSASVFTYDNDLNVFGQGFSLSELGNPALEWQRTQNISLGTDLALMGNRLTATINAYQKLSTPLITSGSVPASMGVSSRMSNVGSLRVKGMEAIVRFSPIYQPSRNIVWTLGYTASIYKSRYEGFTNILKTLNDQAQASKSLQRFLDGYSPDQLWAVTSVGIDPGTGREVFLNKNGEKTFLHDYANIVPQGENRPKIEGVFSSNLNVKGFTLGINLRYSFGAYIFNTALYNKVENITFAALENNQDKRALELRWKQPGDESQFRAITVTASTPISSRFIQRENFISFESINVGYEFREERYKWLHYAGLKTLRLNAYMNEIYRLSNIQTERGINYPFSNAVSFSLNVFF